MSEKFRLDRKIGFRNTFYTKCTNVIIDSIGPSIILRSILQLASLEGVISNSQLASRNLQLATRNLQIADYSDSVLHDIS